MTTAAMPTRGLRCSPGQGLVVAWVGLMAALWLLRLGAAPLFDVDEGAFAEATREMLAQGDFGHTTLNGVDRFDKPILTYWAQAASVALLGLSEFALRLPSVLASLAWGLAVVAFARSRLGLHTALQAGTVLMCSLGVVAVGRAATADALLNLWIALAAFDIWRHVERNDPAARNRAWLWMSLGLLTKGPVALVVPWGATLVWAWTSRRWAAVRSLAGHAPGWLMLLAVAGPWYAYALHRHGRAFVEGFLWHHNIERFTGALEGHQGFPGYHVVVLPLLMLPWTPLLWGVAARWREHWRDPLDRWLMCWAGFVVVFFSLAATRLPHYGLYGLTPLALLAARQLPRASAALRLGLAGGLVLTAALALLVPVLAPWWLGALPDATLRATLQAAPSPQPFWWGAACLAGVSLGLWRGQLSRPDRLTVHAVVLTGVLTGLVVPWWGEALQGPVRRLARQAQAQVSSGTGIVQWGLHRPSVAVYLQRPVPRRTPHDGELALTPLERLDRPGTPPVRRLAVDGGLALVERAPREARP